MAIELLFRAGYFVVAFLLLFFSRTFVLSSVVLAFSAWLAYGHPAHNSAGQEVLAFALSWGAAALAATLLGATISSDWVIDFEWRLVTKRRTTLRVADAVTWLLALVVAALAYAATELSSYDRDTFYRVRSLLWLILLSLILYAYDQIVNADSYRFLPAKYTYAHKVAALLICGAVLVDTLVRQPSFWSYLVVPGLGWLALQPIKLFINTAAVRREHAIKSQ